MSSTFKKTKSVFVIFLALVAPSLLGYVAGWFTGRSSGELAVAALLPSVISLGGMAIIWKTETSGDFIQSWIPSLSIILFAGFLYYGAEVGDIQKRAELDKSLQIAQQRALKWKMTELAILWEFCTTQELKINAFRAELDLVPLSSSVFCSQLSQ